MVACHVCSQHPKFTGVVHHINTGIGAKYTREFVESVCEKFGWTLVVHKSNFPYERFVREKGFPGPGAHQWAYNRLKDRCVYKVTKGAKRTLLITGCRQQESLRRMGHVSPVQVGEVSKKTGEVSRKNRIWCAPCFDWSKEEQQHYMDEHGLPVNKLKVLLGMSGECFCGAFAMPGELDQIRKHAPDVAQEIDRLAVIAKTQGLRRCEWGQRYDTVQKLARTGPMCQSCDYKMAKQGVLFEC